MVRQLEGDFDNDNKVGIVDLNILLANWGNGYGIVELNLLLANWGKETTDETPESESEPEPQAKNIILCLHGGGGSAEGFQQQPGIQDLIRDISNNFDFEFLNAPENGLWWQDTPGGKNEPTTDPDWANSTIEIINQKN